MNYKELQPYIQDKKLYKKTMQGTSKSSRLHSSFYKSNFIKPARLKFHPK